MIEKAGLVDDVLDIEIDVFLMEMAIGEGCRESSEAFRLTRRIYFETWSEKSLQLYLADLNDALRDGRNLITEKYAKINGLMPFISFNPVIDNTIRIEMGWRNEMAQKYPYLIAEDVGSRCTYGVPNFEIYLRAELEAYSNETLESFLQDISEASADRRNLLEEMYLRMFQRLGYNTLEEVEAEEREKEYFDL